MNEMCKQTNIPVYSYMDCQFRFNVKCIEPNIINNKSKTRTKWFLSNKDNIIMMADIEVLSITYERKLKLKNLLK